MSTRSVSAGFTMVELMVVLGIFAVLAGVAMPQLGEMLASRKVGSVAHSLAASYRNAQAEAIRRNRTVEVLFTSAVPVAANAISAAPTAATGARNWLARTTNPATTDDFVGGMALDGDLAKVDLGNTTLRSVAFTPSGRPLDLSSGTAAALAAPLVVRVSTAGTARRLCVTVATGGAVRVCDPSRPAGNPAACVPLLPAGAC